LFIKENLSDCSDITYNEQLAKSIISVEDFSDLSSPDNMNEYVVRKHIRNIMKFYLTEVKRARKIEIKDKQKFGLHMESIGLNIGWSNETATKSYIPDGNVVVMAALTVMIVYLLKK
jgi:hypothetical protein